MDNFAHDIDNLLERYIDVCNQAITQNEHRFPFNHILGAAQKAERDTTIEVNIIGAQANSNHIIKIHQGRIIAAPHGHCTNCDCDRTWSIDRKYLEQVNATPHTYIQNPAKINWEWMHDAPR